MEKINLPRQFMDLAIPRQLMEVECQQWYFWKTPQENMIQILLIKQTNKDDKNADQVEHHYFISKGIRITQQNGLPRF